MSKFLGLDRVFVLSPHPDDAEYCMSGTMCKYTDTKFYIFLMSLGTKTDNNDGRWNEVNEYWATRAPGNVKVDLVSGLTLEDPLYMWTDFVDTFWKNMTFDAVIGPTSQDSHFEHKIANSLMHSLVRKSPSSVLEYRCISTLHEWVPNLFVPLSPLEYERKLLSIREVFKSQLDSRYFDEDAFKAFHTDFISFKKGVEFVESFKILVHYGE